MSKRNLIREIQDRRARVAANLERLGVRRIQALRSLAVRSKGAPAELLRYFPVAAIAAIEVYVKRAVAELVDQKPARLSVPDVKSLLGSTKLDWGLFAGVAGKEVTVGELVGHVVSVSRLDQIDGVFSALLGYPFLTRLRQIRHRHPDPATEAQLPPILPDADEVFAAVERCFDTRHLIAHEDVVPAAVEITEVIRFLGLLDLFVDAMHSVVDVELFPDAPLTQAGMNQRAADTAAQSEQVVNDMLAAVVSSQRIGGPIERLGAVFREYRQLRAEVAATAFEGGTMAPLFASLERTEASKEFAEFLQRQTSQL